MKQNAKIRSNVHFYWTLYHFDLVFGSFDHAKCASVFARISENKTLKEEGVFKVNFDTFFGYDGKIKWIHTFRVIHPDDRGVIKGPVKRVKMINRVWSLITGRVGLRNGKIMGAKRFFD